MNRRWSLEAALGETISMPVINKTVFDMKDQVVIVTGSSSGIGEATAILFAKFGAKLTIHGRDAEKLANVERACREAGATAVLQVVGDISLNEVQDRLINQTVATYGQLDVLVNNAGVVYENALEKSDTYIDNFDRLFSVNVRAPCRMTSLAVPYLTATKGNVVNVSSVAAIKGYPKWSAYCASKAGLDGFTRCAALELGALGIRVNSVNPGFVVTDIIREVAPGIDKEVAMGPFAEWNALKRVGRPAEVAWEIVFLASDKASYITGSVHYNCGGLYI